jgi:hypothetical protein
MNQARVYLNNVVTLLYEASMSLYLKIEYASCLMADTSPRVTLFRCQL